jgi:hypothetical protein
MVRSSELEIKKCSKVDEVRFETGYCILLNESVKKTGFDNKKDAQDWIKCCVLAGTIIEG